MKKLLTLIIILLIAVLMTQTVPDKKAHKEAMMKAIKEYVDEKAEEKGFGNNVLTKIGKAVINKGIEVALNTKLKVHNYYLLNTTSVRLDGKDQLLSVGVLGQVITFDKDMLKERLEKAEEIEPEEYLKGRSSSFQNTNIDQEDNIHHQRINNGWNSHYIVVKHKRTARNGDSLGSILHAYLNHDSALLLTRQLHQP